MRVTLVHPAGFGFVPGQPDFAVPANRMAPIGILALAAWLEKHRHRTAVHDCLGPCASVRSAKFNGDWRLPNCRNFTLHPRQPRNLPPQLGPESRINPAAGTP